MTGEQQQQCEWVALCDRPAEHLVSHPTLGSVPTCARCITKYELADPEELLDQLADLQQFVLAWCRDPQRSNALVSVTTSVFGYTPLPEAVTIWTGTDLPSPTLARYHTLEQFELACAEALNTHRRSFEEVNR